VRDLCAEAARDGLGRALHTLVRKQVIVPEASTFAAEDAFRFGHILVRDAAYAGLAKRTRADLHERFARWLEVTRGGRSAGYEEILGYHLERAATYRRALGDTADAERVAAEASARLAAGGRRALASGDLPAAANLLARAADILPAHEPERLAIRLESIPALVETSQIEQADSGLGEILARTNDRTLLLAANAWRGFVDVVRVRCTLQAGAVPVEAWLADCQRRDDAGGQATALGLLAYLRFQAGQSTLAEEVWQRAAEHAARAGDPRAEAEALGWLLISALYGPTPVPLALERCESIASRAGATHKVKAYAMIQRGVLEAMQGQAERGRASVAQGRRQLEELGLVSIGAQQAAAVEQWAEDPLAGEAILRPSLARLAEIGEQGRSSTNAGLLAHVLYAQDRLDETKSFLRLCQETAGDDDVWSQYLWRSALAKVTAREGDHVTALQLAEEAAALAATTEFLTDHADRLVDLAEVHALAGRHSEVLAALDHADALYARKGCDVALNATRRRRAALADDT
jgi:tetratricopeptide (TPR) repeat protein